jgi:hypothetical protein
MGEQKLENGLRQATGRLVVAVILGLAIWNLLVSLMRGVVAPWLGWVMGPNSSLAQRFNTYDSPALFVAVLESCLAGFVAACLNWLLERSTRSSYAVRPVSVVAAPQPVAAPAPVPVAPNPVPSEGPVATSVRPAPPPAAPPVPPPFPVKEQAAPAPPPPRTKPGKPKKEKPVYYNIVGEPLPDDDD